MNHELADGASERLDAQIAEALFGQPGMSKMDVANRLRQLRGNGKPLLCGNCYGLGVIGYTSGQTPEQFEQGEYPCPDCAQPSPGGQGDALDEVAWDLPALFGRASLEGHEAGQRLAKEVQAKMRAALAARQPVGDQHPDDVAVDAFAATMKAKMAEARAKGRGGWEDPTQCSADDLTRMLRDHVEKGDPRDVANFCMMLHQRGEAIAARQPVDEVSVKKEDANNYCLILRALGMEEEGDPVAEVQALIEARDRQPVGEPVAWLVHWSDMPLESPEVTRSASRISEVSALTNPPRIVPLYAAPPALAVDLDKLRLLGQRIEQVGRNAAPTAQGSGNVYFRNVIDWGRELLALIDGQAVGNG